MSTRLKVEGNLAAAGVSGGYLNILKEDNQDVEAMGITYIFEALYGMDPKTFREKEARLKLSKKRITFWHKLRVAAGVHRAAKEVIHPAKRFVSFGEVPMEATLTLKFNSVEEMREYFKSLPKNEPRPAITARLNNFEN